MGEALKTLQRALLIHLLSSTTSCELPLILDKKRSLKLLFLDTGLMNYYVGLQKYFYTIKDLYSIYDGVLAEHITGQELLALDMESPNESIQNRSENGITFENPVDVFSRHAGRWI